MTSGLRSAIHFLEKSKPLNTGSQYGVSVFLLSHAAPMAGTCETFTLATILATLLLQGFAHLSCGSKRPATCSGAARRGQKLFVHFFFHSDLLRLPWIGRPPFSIISAYCSWVSPVMVAATNWNDSPSVENNLERK